jgi:hypothetical protein
VWIPDWECEWTCVVHHIPERHSDKITLEKWEVIPYGVTEDSHETMGYSIMARIRHYQVPPALPAPEPEDREEENNEDDPHVFLGPFGQQLSFQEWSSLTRRGCGNCSRDLFPTDHEYIFWTGEMECTPICGVCADYMDTELDPNNYRGVMH